MIIINNCLKRFKFFYEQVVAVKNGVLKRPITKFEQQFLDEGRVAYSIIQSAEESVKKLKNKLDFESGKELIIFEVIKKSIYSIVKNETLDVSKGAKIKIIALEKELKKRQ